MACSWPLAVVPRNELLFVPLGGSGEIGMNLNLYGYDGRWLMVDCGITFDNSHGPTDIHMPDPRFIAEQRDRLVGLVITHAHEDHIGAVVHLWEQLECPVYATPFPAAVLRRKMREAELDHVLELHVVETSSSLTLDPFELTFIGVTHSTIESSAVVIETPLGRVFHTGDFKLDPDPLVGPVTESEAIRAWGERGLLAVVGDSTNATKEGRSGSEGELRRSLIDVFARFEHRIAAACFASNIARVQTLVEIATKLERHPIVVGRSLHRMIGAARKTEYLPTFEHEVSSRDFGYLPPSKVFLICTGTQGEPGAALTRMSSNDHPDVFLERNDAVVFSSKIIPGNEEPIGKLHERFRRKRLSVVSEREAFVHVSGHPARDELRTLYAWTQPRVVVPVHGEQRHMEAHAALARECGIEHSLVPFNGAVVRLAPGPAEIVGKVHAGRVMLDPSSRDHGVVSLEEGSRKRRRPPPREPRRRERASSRRR